MSANKHPLDKYKRFLLNRATCDTPFVEFIENLLASEDQAANYCFHKIMVHNWHYQNELLFDVLSDYFTAWFLPVDVSKQRDITIFYTSNLNFVLRLTRLDFMFPHDRNMFNIDVLFNDKTSVDFFDNNVTLDDVISSIVSRRFSDKKELDLSNFCEDQEFKEKKIEFYKVSLLTNFKMLMLRLGRDTKSLNLTNNKLLQPPQEIMNFFIKGDLTAINLSYNQIKSITDLYRVSSKIEKLWVEGNPLCEDQEPSIYLKQITMKFPRLTELDGIRLNEFGVEFPFNRNYMNNPTKYLKMLVEKFLTVYFSHYDTTPRLKNMEGFYDAHCTLTITTDFTDMEKLSMTSKHAVIGDNILNIKKKTRPLYGKTDYSSKTMYKGLKTVVAVLNQLPKTQHDPSTFTVDVISHNKKNVMIIVDGIYEDIESETGPKIFRFRRTFLFKVYKPHASSPTTVYTIHNELFHIAIPTPQQLQNCFKFPIRNMNTMELVNPDSEDTEVILKIFCHITQLKKEEAETRLRQHNWDIRMALNRIISDLNEKSIKPESFMEVDNFSDTSSLIDDEMVD